MVLCDGQGRPHGLADALAVHTGLGQLHLAFSVYVFSPDRRALLLQQRSTAKMLWPAVWANTCCSHPRPGEDAITAGRRRLQEEMGFDCELALGPGFAYRAEDPHGRGVEHEYDRCLIGHWSGEPRPNPAEVCAWKWTEVFELQRSLHEQPDQFAPWLHLGLPLVLATP